MKQQGFTLLELLIYIAIVSIVVVVLASAVVSFMRAKARAEAITETDEALRFVGERITRDVEGARTLMSPEYAQASSTLTLTRDNVVVRYTIAGGAVVRVVGSTTEVLTNSRVTIGSMLFERTENYQPVTAATSTGVRWNIRARHAFLAPEYAYDAERAGSAEVRNEVTP